MFDVIPIGLNGLVKPTPLRTYSDAEVDWLKSVFAAGTTSGFFVTPDTVRHFSREWLQESHALDRDEAQGIFMLAAPLVTRVHLASNAGLIPFAGNCRIESTQLHYGDLQVDAADNMHVDASLMYYQENLANNCITLRSLFVTEQPPLVVDLSDEADPFKLLGRGYNLDALEEYGLKSGRARHMPNRTAVMMDMVTAHKAFPVFRDTQRLLADLRIDVRLPDDWRAGRLKSLNQKPVELTV